MTHSNMLRNQQIIKEERPAPSKPPKSATNNPVELAKKRIAEFKKTLTPDNLKEIQKIVPVTDGSFRIYYNDKNIETVWPSGRYLVTSGADGAKYMGTFDNNWKRTSDSAEQIYKHFRDKAWLESDEMAELGLKWNRDTKKYERIDQSNTTQPENTTTPDNTTTPENTTTPTPTPKKRGTPLNAQDYEGINFKYKYPNDRNYEYGVKNNEWYAKNINNEKVFNISKDGFTSSVNYLNAQFPDAFKEVTQQTTPPVTQQDTTTPPVTVQDTTTPPVTQQDTTKKVSYLNNKPYEGI